MTTAKEKKTMPMTLDQLEQEASQAMARVTEAQAAADAIRLRAEQARLAAEHLHDEQVVAAWNQDRQQIEQDIAAARQRLREALAADPVWAAVHALVLAGHRQTTRHMEADSTMNRLHGQSIGAAPHTVPPTYEELARLVEADASAQGRDEAAARDQARVDAGQQAADAEAGRQV